MTTRIEVREIAPQRLLVKKATCAHKDIGPAFGAAIHSVRQCLSASAAKMASPPMAVYLAWRDSDCDLAAGCEVEGEVALSQGCEWLDLPGGPHAFASHFGPYAMLGETHGAIRSWCNANELKIANACWEAYPVDPGSEPDSSKWQTDVYYPVAAEQVQVA